MPTSDRALEMLSFEEEKGLMTNARCVTEGVDLPAIDCVCFTDPKRSKVDIVQAAGRALRLSKGKKYGYGNLVEISHLNGYVTRYAHNNRNLVKKGDLIKDRLF